MKPFQALRWLAAIALWLCALSAHALSLSPASLTLLPGGSASIALSSVSGSPKVSVADTAVASAAMVSGKVRVTAKAVGSTTLAVTDRKGTVYARITVKAPMTLSPATLSVGVGQSASATINSPFGAVSLANSNGTVASASVAGSTITVTGRKAGSATISVYDGKTRVSLAVTVSAGTPSSALNGRLLASNCFQCHGTNGSGGFDSIRGSSELLDELREFAYGTEDAGGIMGAHAQGYTDAQLQAIANYLKNQ